MKATVACIIQLNVLKKPCTPSRFFEVAEDTGMSTRIPKSLQIEPDSEPDVDDGYEHRSIQLALNIH